MKIHRIELESFGKFRNYSMEFADGFNRIYGENEFGKTTIMSFIYLMFYGKSDGDRSSDVQKSIRKKYMPWNREPMSGSMEFEAEGVRYRLHKLFGKTITTDEVQLIALDSGQEIPLAKEEEIGRRFLGMDAAGFEKSVFISTTGSFAGKDTSDDIAIRLSNLIEAGDESVSGTVVLSRITEAKEALISKNKKKGSLIALREEVFEMKEYRRTAAEKAQIYMEQEVAIQGMQESIREKRLQIERLQRQEQILTELEELPRLQAIHEKITLLNGQIQKYSSDQDHVVGVAQEFQAERATLISQLALYEEEVEDSLVLIEEEEYTQFKIQRQEREQAKMLKEFMEHAVLPELERFQKTRKIQEEYSQEPPEKKREYLFLILALLCMLAGVGVAVLQFYVGAVAAVVAGLFFAMVFLLRNQSFTREYQQAAALFHGEVLKLASDVQNAKGEYLRCLQNLEEKARQNIEDVSVFYQKISGQYHEKSLELETLLEELGCREEEIEERYRQSLRVLELRRATKKLEEKRKEKQEALRMLFNKDTLEEAEAFLQNLLDQKEASKSASTEKKAVLSAIGKSEEALIDTIKELEAKQHAICSEDGTLEEIKEQINLLSGAVDNLTNQTFELGRLMDPGAEDLEMLDGRFRALKEELEDREAYYRVLEGTELYMKKAVEAAGSTFGPTLNREAADIFSGLTGGKYPALLVDREFGITVKGDSGAFKDWKYLSNGTIDQAYLSLRLAMTRLLTKGGETLPLLLDDILIQYDDQRATQALSYLTEYSKEAQVLYFTCHK